MEIIQDIVERDLDIQEENQCKEAADKGHLVDTNRGRQVDKNQGIASLDPVY